MRLLLLILYLVSGSSASPITLQLAPNEKECVYVDTAGEACHISYYFAVQEGEYNAFNVEYELWSPENKDSPINAQKDKVQGEWTFAAVYPGEYALCVIGDNYTKIVDLDIVKICADEPDKPTDSRLNIDSIGYSQAPSVEDSVNLIERQLQVLERNLKFYKSRSERNNYTVRSIRSRIGTISMWIIILVPLLALLQIILMKYVMVKFGS